MAKKLQSNFIRRIEKTLTSIRPDIPISGTNHVDDYTEWTSNMLYKGELGVSYNCGTLWTQDGETGVELNTEDVILEGLVLSNVGASGTYLAVSDGYARLNGRTYVYKTPSVSNPSSITIDGSSGAAGPRIDTIIAVPGTNYNSAEDLYELEIQVIKGDVYSPGCLATKLWPPQITDLATCGTSILLGFAYVPANLNQATTPLYPLAVVDAIVSSATAQPSDPYNIGSPYYTTFPLPIMSTNDFIRRRQRTNFEWQPNTLYFEKQLLYVISGGCGTLYEVVETYQSSSTVATDISNLNLIEFCGAGGGSVSINTFADIGYPPSVGVPSFSDGYFSDWDSTTRIIDSIAYLNSLIGKLAPPSPNAIDDITLVLSENMGAFSAKALTGAIVSNVINEPDTPAVAITPVGNPFKDFNDHCPMFGFFNSISNDSGIIYDDDAGFDLPEVPTYYSLLSTSSTVSGSMQIKVSVGTDISENPMLIKGRNLLVREIADSSNYFYVSLKSDATWSSNILTISINDNTSFSQTSADFTEWEVYIADFVDATDAAVLNVAKVDPYENIDQKDDIYTAFSASVMTISTVAASQNENILGINYRNATTTGVQGTCSFYVENLSTPIISITTGPQGIHYAEKYLSGVPVLSTSDKLKMTFEVEDAANYFYNKDQIVSVINNNDFDSFILTDSDSDGGAPSPASPYDADDHIFVYTNNEALTVSDEACSDGLSFYMAGYNARGTENSDIGTLLVETNIVADSATEEIPTPNAIDPADYVPSTGRFTSGTGTYPTLDVPWIFDNVSDWGYPYDIAQSQVDITTNEELQLGPITTNSGQVLCGYYHYPSIDYSTMNIVNTTGTPVAAPDYSSIPDAMTNDFRWATFYVGTVETAIKYLKLRIVGGEGINEDWQGLTMTPNFQFQVKIIDFAAGDSTGWLDGNTAYDSSSPNDPEFNGDAALDASFGEGALFRRITFGQTAREGSVWVRVGIKYYDDNGDPTNMRFRNVSLITSDSATDGDGWTYKYIDTSLMPYLSHIQYLKLSLTGSGFPFPFSDPDSPNTMTPGLELQVKLDSTTGTGTDWVSANDVWSPAVPMPYNLGDPALDVSSSAIINQLERRVTFGAVTGGRSGYLNIRYRVVEGSPIIIGTINLEEYS